MISISLSSLLTELNNAGHIYYPYIPFITILISIFLYKRILQMLNFIIELISLFKLILIFYI
jgi:hypothetical protein